MRLHELAGLLELTELTGGPAAPADGAAVGGEAEVDGAVVGAEMLGFPEGGVADGFHVARGIVGGDEVALGGHDGEGELLGGDLGDDRICPN
mgnify:CR=1 FL=1